MDSSTGRLTVFADIVRKNRFIRTAYLCYDSVPGFIKSYLLILYGLKCYLSANWQGSSNPDVLFCAAYPNERVALGHIRGHLRGLTVAEIALSRFHCFRPDSLRTLPAFISQSLRLQRVALRLVRQCSFLPACRIFSTMTYYLRFRRLLGAHAAKAVFIANHYSPECLALAAAAHSSGRKVIVTNHANGTWRSGYVPPLHGDLIAVTSAAILEAYQRHSPERLNAVFIPQALPQQPMRHAIDCKRPVTVGIFLTALTNRGRLEALVDQLEANPWVGRILIRSHPVKVVNEDLSALVAGRGRVAETSGLALTENAVLCDVAICGNSTVTIDLLRGGLPVLYDADLDDLACDLNGYLEHALVPALPANLDATAFKILDRFYSNSSWVVTMRHFDAGYLQSEETMLQGLNDALHRSIRLSQPRGAAVGGHDVSDDLPYPAALS